jgi:hypothetical protein
LREQDEIREQQNAGNRNEYRQGEQFRGGGIRIKNYMENDEDAHQEHREQNEVI